MLALGLDISTSCTGWCIIEFDQSAVTSMSIGALRLDNIEKTYQKANVVRDFFLSIKTRNFDRIFIEENLQSFSSGLSSAQTLVTLARFNGIVSYISEDVLGVSPTFINVNTARNSLGLKTIKEKVSGIPLKEQVHNWVKNDHIRRNLTVEWPTKCLKSGSRKGQVILDSSAFDMSDAYVIAMAGLIAL
jgi:Holliday junction resolvasome RuvABC endonuclease subunit